jgi:amidase
MTSRFGTADYHLTREHHTQSFGSAHSPALRVSAGETIHVQTWDCYKGVIQTDADLIKDVDLAFVNPATGPIYIDGAEPGDTLSVTLIDIQPEERGVARLGVGEGQLHDKVKAPYGRFFSVIDGMVSMNETVSFPAVPMLGVIGVAPESGEIATMPAGKHGGNLDNNMNRKGSIVHLPVKHKGALLGMGDMHASMGDGEICGTGVEIAGDVLIKVEVIKGITTDFPVTETADSWITHGVAVEDLTLAIKLACEEAAGLLVNHWGFTYEDAFIFLSVAGDLGIAQSVHPSSGTVIAKMRVPKIAACPKPFKI